MVRGGIILDGLEGSVAWIEGTHSDCLWVLFLDPLYIHRDAKIIIVRVGFLKSAFMKRINRRDLLVSLPEFDGFLVRKLQNEHSFGDLRYVNVFLVEMDGFR